MLKSEQIALFTKSLSSSTHSEKRPLRGKSNDKPPTCPTGTKCHIYGKEGHWAPECCSKSIKRNNSYYSKNSANLAVKHIPFLGEYKVSQMLIVLSNTISSIGILLDYGVTSYMFMFGKYFTNYTKSLNKFVTIGRHNQVPVIDHECIHFTALLPNNCFSIILYDILHIPYLSANLVSLGALHH